MKYFSCPVCEKVMSDRDWNKATKIRHGIDIGRIETKEKSECNFVCPYCGHEDEGNYINFEYETTYPAEAKY